MGEPLGGCCTVGHGRQVIKLTRDDERGDVGIGRGRGRNAPGGISGRCDRPKNALINEAIVERYASKFIDRKRAIRVRRHELAVRDNLIAVAKAHLRRKSHVKDLRRVVTHDGRRQPGAELRRQLTLIARVHARGRLCHEPQQWRAVTRGKSARRSVELAHARVGGRACEHDRRQARGICREAHQRAVGVARLRIKCSAAQQRERRSYVIQRRTGQLRALKIAAAGDIEFGAHRGRVTWVPRIVRSVERVGPVEYDRAQHRGMAQRKYLREIRSVRIAVEIDGTAGERLEDRCKVIGREGRGVKRRLQSQLAAACADVFDRDERGRL
jgi:predicted RNA-binding protein YlqC (UPF0109 family)